MTERQDKRAQFEQGKKRGGFPWIFLAAIVLAGGAFGAWMAVDTGEGAKYPLLSAAEGQIVLPLAQVSDGKAHFFSYRQGDTTIDFFVLRSKDGVLRAALDTCDVCYQDRKGYRQEGDFMVCNNCDQRFRSDMINEVRGGCNPAPLERTVADGRLIIREADLAGGVRYFSQIKGS